MCIIALAPEIGVAMAVEQFMTAREMSKKFKALHFTMVHSFYALMGGFVIAVPRSIERQDTTRSSDISLDIYCLECKDFGKCFTMFLLLLCYSSRPVHLLASVFMCVNPRVPIARVFFPTLDFCFPL
jgi:hypothetical protein